MRISRSTQHVFVLLLLILSSTNFLNLRLFPNNDLFKFLIPVIILLILSFAARSIRINYKGSKFWIFFYFGIFASVLSCKFHHNQELGVTLLAQREVYLGFIYYTILILIKPDIFEIKKAFILFSVIYVGIFIIQYSIFPEIQIAYLERFVKGNSKTFFISGFSLIPICYYILNEKLQNNRHVFNFLLTIVIIIIFFLAQNRSQLFAILIITLFIVFNKYNQFKNVRFLYFVLFVTIVFFSWTIIEDLLSETVINLTDKNYPRWRTFSYFADLQNQNPLLFTFGSGYPSTHSEYGKSIVSLREKVIYQADLGILNTWIMFGVFTFGAVLLLLFSVINDRNMPYFAKLAGWHLLITPLIYGFWVSDQLFVLSVLLYLKRTQNS